MPSKWRADGTLCDGDYDVQLTGSNALVTDTTGVWANSAAANTSTNIDVVLPPSLQGNAMYEITVTNPSVESDLTIVVKNKETFSGTSRYPELTRFGIPKNSTDGKCVLVQGWMLGEAGRISISNDTVLGAAGAFVAYVRVRKV